MKILGISYGYHDAAAALLVDGKLLACAQEERFNRVKHYSGMPKEAINYCLQSANLIASDLDHIVFYERPYLKFARSIWAHLHSAPFSFKHFSSSMPQWLGERLSVDMNLKEELSFDKDILFVKHHLAHAASAFFASPFEKSAVLVSDGVGEWSTLSFGIAEGNRIEMLKELTYPDSLGLIYSAITAYLGFFANSCEGKTMGLADWGSPCFYEELCKTLVIKDDGSFKLDRRFWDFTSGRAMFTKRFIKTFGPPRLKHEEILPRHMDMAASVQKLTEEILIKIARHVYDETKCPNLSLAGGSFLNIPTNSRIISDTPFERIYVQPAASDAGGALGAALYVSAALLGEKRDFHMTRADWGPSFTDAQIERYLKTQGANFKKLEKAELLEWTSDQIAQDKIVGWFQGRMEFGPRALGRRSILANPANANMKDLLNAKVKHRESFRPYGVSVLKEDAKEFFHLSEEGEDFESPFMLRLAFVKDHYKDKIPSAVHVNGTSRIQTLTREDDGIYYQLLETHKKRHELGVIINTSFNDNDEPIVLSPEDAYRCFIKTHMDALVIGSYVVTKN